MDEPVKNKGGRPRKYTPEEWKKHYKEKYYPAKYARQKERRSLKNRNKVGRPRVEFTPEMDRLLLTKRDKFYMSRLAGDIGVSYPQIYRRLRELDQPIKAQGPSRKVKQELAKEKVEQEALLRLPPDGSKSPLPSSRNHGKAYTRLEAKGLVKCHANTNGRWWSLTPAGMAKRAEIELG